MSVTPLLGQSSDREKEKALSLLATAHALLLANHGQLTSLTARSGLGSLSSQGFQLNLLPGFDSGLSAECVERFTEAQMYVRRALEELHVTQTAPSAGLNVVGREAAIFGGVFDLLALATDVSNLQHNRRLGEEVRAIYDAIRLSDPQLAERSKPLATFDLDTGETGVARVFDYVSPVVGSPRFWSTEKKIVFLVLGPILVLAFVIGMIFVFIHAMRGAPYDEAMQIVQHDSRAVAALGEPIRAGWGGSASRDETSARLEIPVSGPRGAGDLEVKARKKTSGWVFDELQLTVHGSEIDLQSPPEHP